MIRNEWDLPDIGLRRLGAQDIAAFWRGYSALCAPGLKHGSLWSRWREVSDDTIISLYLTNRSVGMFVRGQRGERYATTAQRLSAHEPQLGAALGSSLRGEYGLCYLVSRPTATTDLAQWSQAFDWLDETEGRYIATLQRVLTNERR